MTHPYRNFLVGCIGLTALALAGQGARAADKPSSPEAGYAGADTCVVCHEEHVEHFNKTNPHANVPSSWGVTGCESCHGPGQAHVDAEGDVSKIRRFTQMKGGEASQYCLSCHERGVHAAFVGGPHDSRDIGCTKCHSVHSSKREDKLLREKTEFDLCTSCHLKRKGSLMRSSHMPMREGSMTCSSCHNPHGGVGPSNLKAASPNDLCYTCHAEKRAPMLWEHPPVKENCMNCHDPHGSLHGSLLVAKRPQLCQQCHDEARHPTTPYGSSQAGSFFPNTRIFNKACNNCHAQIHGSNHPSGVRFHR